MPQRRRWRRGNRGRFPKPVTIPNPSTVERLIPEPRTSSESIILEPAEVETLRLVDLEGLSQEELFGGFYKVQEKKLLKL
jgi:predicted DNA-binding protein (UPF0251 family)